MTSPRGQDQFLSAINPFMDLWQTIDIRIVALKLYDEWINLGLKMTLCSGEPRACDLSSLPDLPFLKAIHQHRDISDLPNLLREFESAAINVHGRVIRFGRIEANQFKTTQLNFSFLAFRLSDDHQNRAGLTYPCFELRSSGEQLHLLLFNHDEPVGNRLDWELRAQDSPYDGIDELLSSFLELPLPAWGRVTESANIWVVAPIRVRLSNTCHLHQGRLKVGVEAEGINASTDMSIGLVQWHGDRPGRRTSEDISESTWAKRGDAHIAELDLNAENASSVKLFLRYRGETLETRTVDDPLAVIANPRVLAYTHFDSELSALKSFLNGSGKDKSRDFEKGISLLFHLCGFNVGAHFLVRTIQDEIDLLAFLPNSKNVLALECTFKDLDKEGKLSKLSRKVKDVREHMTGFEVIGVIATPLEMNKIVNTDLQKAYSEDVRIIAKEQITALLALAAQNRSADEIYGYVNGLLRRSRSDVSDFF